MGKLSKSDIEKATWRDISLQETKTGAKVLVFIFETKEAGERLQKLLHKEYFSVKFSIQKETGNYFIILDFNNSDYGIRYDTERNESQYPALKWIKENSIKYITTGVWMDEKTADGRKLSWIRTDFKQIETINLN